MRRTHPPPDAPARAPAAALPGQLQPLWSLAVAIAESAAEIAATRPIPSWRASACTTPPPTRPGAPTGATARAAGGPTAPGRAAVPLRRPPGRGGHRPLHRRRRLLSNRQLASDLRSGAAWLAAGALLQRGP